MPSRPLPRTKVTHVRQATRPPPDIIIERWCRPEKQLIVIPPPPPECPPLHNIVICYEPSKQTIVPKVDCCGVREVDQREYRRLYGSGLVDKRRVNDEVARILQGERIDDNIVSHSIIR